MSEEPPPEDETQNAENAESTPPQPRKRERGATELLNRIHLQGVRGAMEKAGLALNSNESILSWFSPWLEGDSEEGKGDGSKAD